jgi:hypothetical protein
MKMPNFFILGAPKCGTTSLAAWLAEHSHIYMSPRKEPHFYNTDFCYHNVDNREEYLRLFGGASGQHLAVGEASVLYLASTEAVHNIEQDVPTARYIVMVRNPVEMAPSLHEQMVFAVFEKHNDFSAAWAAQAERAQVGCPQCQEPKLLAYGELCSLGAQLQRLYQSVDRGRVLVVFLDDIRLDPRREYLRVLRFLEVPDDGRTDFPVHNPAKKRRFPFLRRLTRSYNGIRRKLGIPKLQTGIIKRLDDKNCIYRARPTLSADIIAMLQQHFRSDVELLAKLTGRDLTAWCGAPLSRNATTMPKETRHA